MPQRGSTEQLDITSLPDKSCQPGDITEVMPYDSFPATLVRVILDVAAVDMESHRNWLKKKNITTTPLLLNSYF